jgi:hypothetical protein
MGIGLLSRSFFYLPDRGKVGLGDRPPKSLNGTILWLHPRSHDTQSPCRAHPRAQCWRESLLGRC